MRKISFYEKDKFDNLDDQDVIIHIKEGKIDLYEKIYDKRSPKIYSYVLNILNYNVEDANNVLGDVFIKLYDSIKHGNISNLKSFLYRLAHNTSIDFIRTNKSENAYMHDDLKLDFVHDGLDKEKKDQFNLDFKKKLLSNLFMKIDLKFREVLHLYYYEQKSYDEIADIIGSNKNTVGTLISNAKKKLKEIIEVENLEKALLD